MKKLILIALIVLNASLLSILVFSIKNGIEQMKLRQEKTEVTMRFNNPIHNQLPA